MKNFSLNEFRCKCCKELPADAWMYEEHLVNNVLDPVRDAFGKPIKVNSGYRCEKHNKEVGGAKNSQHLLGQAADIAAEHSGYANMTAWKEANMEIARLIIKNGKLTTSTSDATRPNTSELDRCSLLPKFDQLILENVGENDLLPQWLHVSYNPRLCRGQVLKKVAGKAGYQVVSKDEICKLLGAGFKPKN